MAPQTLTLFVALVLSAFGCTSGPVASVAGGSSGTKSSGSCTRDGWCRELPQGFGGRLTDLWANDDGRVIAVGSGGWIGTLRDGVWSFEHTGYLEDLSGVSGGGDRLTVVGKKGFIVEQDGERWVRAESPTKEDLTAVWSDGTTLLVAGLGRIWRRRDARWVELPSIPQGTYLTALWSPDGEQVWTGGGDGGLFQLVRGAWVTHYIGMSDEVAAIAGRNGSVWIATRSALFRHDAQGLRSLAEGGWSDVAVGPEGAVALGDKGIANVRGDDVVPTELSRGGFRLLSVSRDKKTIVGGKAIAEVQDNGNIVIAAGDVAGPNELRKEQTVFAGTGSISLPASGYSSLTAVWGFNDDRVFVAGDEGGIYVGQRAATGEREWKQLRYSGERLEAYKAIWGPSADRVFFVGWNNSSKEYAAGTWNEVPVPFADGMWGVGSNLAYAARRDTVHRWDGSQWSKLDAPAVGGTSVWLSAKDDVWIVGPKIWHFDGTTWTDVKGATTDSAVAVWGRNRNDVFVATDKGVQHFDGKAWSYTRLSEMGDLCSEQQRRDASFYAISGNARGVWAVGQLGLIAAFQDGTWRCELSGTNELLQGVWASDRAVYVPCQDGVIRKEL